MLGKDPYTGEEITLRNGRFGPYVQRGDGKEAKRSSLPKGWTVDTIDHEKALALLSLPRDVGKHPETGKMISAGLGRYGPFVLHDGTYANLESIEDVFSIGLNRAVIGDCRKAGQGQGRARRHACGAQGRLASIRMAAAVTVRDGKYGPYVNFGKVNATLPKGKDPMSVTLEEALAMIAEREAKGGGGKKPSSAQKAGRKKPAARKPQPRKQEGIRPIGTRNRLRQADEQRQPGLRAGRASADGGRLPAEPRGTSRVSSRKIPTLPASAISPRHSR